MNTSELPLFIKTFPWALCLLLGLAMIAGSAWRITKGWQTLRWPGVDGKILSVSLQDQGTNVTAGDPALQKAAQMASGAAGILEQLGSSGQSRKRTYEYKPPQVQTKVTYAYNVDGREYTGHRISFSYMPAKSHTRDTRIVEKLTAAKSVRVYYNPETPSDSTLVTGLGAMTFLLMLYAIPTLCAARVFWLLLNAPPVDYSILIRRVGM